MSWISRLKQRAREQRGVAVLEAAFVTPVFFTLILGVCEIGLCMNDYLAVSSAVRMGAREASTTGADTYSDYMVLQAVGEGSSALNPSKISRIVIFKPTTFGELPTSTCMAGTPSAGTGATRVGACNTYVSTDMNRPEANFGCLTTQNLDRYWCPTSRKITLSTTTSGTGTDYIGVWIQYQHAWLTKMFGTDKTLTDVSIIRLEPRTKT